MSKINKASDEAEKLSSQIHRYVDESKRKLNQLRDEKEKLESYRRAAQHKLKEAQAAKKGVKDKVINIGERLKAAFGVLPKEAKTDGTEKKEKKQFVNKITASTAIAFEEDKHFEALTLKGKDLPEINFGDNIKGNENVFAPPPMVSFSKSKNLVITEIDGSDAEVVERYGDKSWEIKLQGIIIDMKSHKYPADGVVKLREFFNTPEAFEVTKSTMFHNLDINSIYFTNVDISGVSGFADTIQYTLSARSIKPIEFTFTQHNK